MHPSPIALLVLVGTINAAHAQPNDPEPISSAELAVYENILNLSNAQRHAVSFHYESYRRSIADKPAHLKVPEFPSGDPAPARVLQFQRDAESRYRAEIRWLEEMDTAFFATIEPVLSERQLENVPLVMEMRRGKRFVKASAFMRHTVKPLIEFDWMILSEDQRPLEVSRDRVLAYRLELNRRLDQIDQNIHREPSRTMARRLDELGSIRAGPDNEASMTILLEERMPALEMANAVDTFNRQWAFDTASTLGPVDKAELLYRYAHARSDLATQMWRTVPTLQELLLATQHDPKFAAIGEAIELLLTEDLLPRLQRLLESYDEIEKRWVPGLMENPGAGDREPTHTLLRGLWPELDRSIEELFESAPGGVDPDDLRAMYRVASLASQERANQPGTRSRSNSEMSLHASRLAMTSAELRTMMSRLHIWHNLEEDLVGMIEEYRRRTAKVLREARGIQFDSESLADATSTFLDELRALAGNANVDNEDVQLIELTARTMLHMPQYFGPMLRGIADVDPIRFLLTHDAFDRSMALACYEPLSTFHDKFAALLYEREESRKERDAFFSDSRELRNATLEQREVHIAKSKVVAVLSGQLATMVCQFFNDVQDIEPSARTLRDQFMEVALPQVFAPRHALRAKFESAHNAAHTAAQRQALEDLWVDHLQADAAILDELLEIACRATDWHMSGGHWLPALPFDGQVGIFHRGQQLSERQRDLDETTVRRMEVLLTQD